MGIFGGDFQRGIFRGESSLRSIFCERKEYLCNPQRGSFWPETPFKAFKAQESVTHPICPNTKRRVRRESFVSIIVLPRASYEIT
jgi:hypothetical protein